MYEIWRLKLGWHSTAPVESFADTHLSTAVRKFVSFTTSHAIGLYDTTSGTWLMLGKGWTEKGAEQVRIDHLTGIIPS